jgi:hypothetical protein
MRTVRSSFKVRDFFFDFFKNAFFIFRFHSYGGGGRNKISELVRHRRSSSNTSLPEMIANAKQYDSSSAVIIPYFF